MMIVARATLCAWLLVLALPICAQVPARIARIGPGSAESREPCFSAFKQGMREGGLVEGTHYVLDERYADGNYDQFPALTGELLKRNPALVMVSTIASVRAAQQATKTVPIVFVAVNDPLGSGLVANLARPEGNTTGLSNQAEDTMAKNLQLLREVLPRATRVAVLFNPSNGSNPKLLERVRVAAPGLGIAVHPFGATAPGALDAVLGAIAQYRPDALLVIRDAMLADQRDRLAAFALKARIPLFVGQSSMVAAGGLIVYDSSLTDQCRRSATYVKKILAGTRPADLPVEQPTKFELVINLKTAKALGITIPPSVLLRADEVIQ